MIVYIICCIVWSCYSIVQVMSESVAKALPIVVGPTAEHTEQLITVVDRMFDCLNVTSYKVKRSESHPKIPT